jgi:hypothetical protein
VGLLFDDAAFRLTQRDIDCSMNHRSMTNAGGAVHCRGPSGGTTRYCTVTLGEKIIQELRSSGGMENNLWQGRRGVTKPTLPRNGSLPVTSPTTPCSVPVISLFWDRAKILQMSLTSRNHIIIYRISAVDRPVTWQCSLYFSLLAGKPANRDEFADDCLHRHRSAEHRRAAIGP